MFSGDMLDEQTAVVEGYNSYFSFSRKRSGYSGECVHACVGRGCRVVIPFLSSEDSMLASLLF